MDNLTELRLALDGYYRAIASSNSPSEADLLSAIKHLDGLSDHPDPAWPAQLRHYLASRSYRKAKAWLEEKNQNPPALPGLC